MSPPNPAPPSQTQVLLHRWHDGDKDALGEIITRNLDWIRGYVHRRLGDQLRAKDDTQDIVQEALIEFMKFGPKFVIADEIHFRGLVAKIVRNVLADRHAWFTRRRRDMHRERVMPDQSTIHLDPGMNSVTQPPESAAKNEEREYIRLGLELLRPEEREVVIRRHFDGEEFATIAAAMQTTPEAARKRFGRALPRLFALIKQLKNGQLADAIADEGDE
ncbi:MAG: sigma-70 family RNA polymerase sigma factor [Planctomycetes bacterium]|nr:sigma-70 family RNA polymerase sigma factor [Planctomycetota bacterium]